MNSRNKNVVITILLFTFSLLSAILSNAQTLTSEKRSAVWRKIVF
jgi:hypothetical protein